MILLCIKLIGALSLAPHTNTCNSLNSDTNSFFQSSPTLKYLSTDNSTNINMNIRRDLVGSSTTDKPPNDWMTQVYLWDTLRWGWPHFDERTLTNDKCTVRYNKWHFVTYARLVRTSRLMRFITLPKSNNIGHCVILFSLPHRNQDTTWTDWPADWKRLVECSLFRCQQSTPFLYDALI